MNRRNVLIGIGTVAVGSGVALGSGAFSQVEATRTVDLQTSADSGALLQLVANSNSEIVGTEGSGSGVNVLRLEQSNLNDNAKTTVTDGITVTNNGGQSVGFYVAQESSLGPGNPLNFKSSNGTVVGSTNHEDLGSGGSVNIDVVINLEGNNDLSNLGNTEVTFVADVSV